MTQIDIYSGFLGAGKTTLIKKMIKEAYAGQKLVLIENEFGEIGIDGGFLKDAGIEITEMNSGCICCSLVGDFGKALEQVISQYAPDRILIEPSGVGKLSDVEAAVEKVVNDDVQLGNMVTVADAGKCKMYMKNFGEFYNNQVESAGTIILSRTGSISEEKLDAAVKLLREKNPHAVIVTTPWDQLTGAQILEAMEQGNTMLKELEEEHHHHEHEHHHDHDEHDEHCGCGCHDHDHEEHEHHHDHDHEHEEHEHHHDHDHEHDEHCGCGCHDHDHDHDHEHHHHDHDHDHDHHHHHHHGDDCTCGCHNHDHEHDHHHHHHHADEVFDSWGVETVHVFTRSGLEDIMGLFSTTDDFGTVLRAKGIVETEDGSWVEFDMVPEEVEIRETSPDYIGRICVIGADLNKEELARVFDR